MSSVQPSGSVPGNSSNQSPAQNPINLKNAATNVQTYIKNDDFTYSNYKENPVMVFQLATLYNASQAIAGKLLNFNTKNPDMEKPLSEKQFSGFMQTIQSNLSRPSSTAEAKDSLVTALAGTFGDIGSAQEQVNTLTTDASSDLAQIQFGNLSTSQINHDIPILKNTETQSAQFNEVKDQMGDFANQLITDKSVGFNAKSQSLCGEMMHNPVKGSSIGTKFLLANGDTN